MSATTSMIETGFAPWSMTAPTRESKVPTNQSGETFTLSGQDTSKNLIKTTQVAHLGDVTVQHHNPATPYGASSKLPETRPLDEKFSAIPNNQIISEGDFDTADLIDFINPLQHIPIVSSIYREVTGDEIETPARLVGGVLFGGIIGFASSVANSIVDETTGQDIGEHFFSFFSGDNRQNNTNDLIISEEAQPKASPIQQALAPSQEQKKPVQVAALDAKPTTENPVQMQAASGQMADKLAAIPQAAGGLNMTHMPGAILNDPNNIQEVAAATTAPKPLPVDREVTFKPLSRDVSRQLDRIRQMNGEASLLSLQEQAAAPVKTQPAKIPEKLIEDTARSTAQLAAYQNTQALTNNAAAHPHASAGEPIDISNAMMEALQKYDALLNGS